MAQPARLGQLLLRVSIFPWNVTLAHDNLVLASSVRDALATARTGRLRFGIGRGMD